MNRSGNQSHLCPLDLGLERLRQRLGRSLGHFNVAVLVPVDKLQEICILGACTCQKPAICVRLRSLVGAAIL
jgi:hypothetical protein